MLRRIGLTNFKSFVGRHDASLGRITLIYGENSSGKSSLLQALLLLKQSFGTSRLTNVNDLQFRGHLVDLGSFRATVSQHKPRNRMSLSFEADSPIRYRQPYSAFTSSPINWELTYRSDGDGTQVSEIHAGNNSFDSSSRIARKNNREDLYAISSSAVGTLVDYWASGEASANSGLELDGETLSWIRNWLLRTPLDITFGVVPAWDPDELRSGRPGRPVGGSLDSPKRVALQTFVYDWQYNTSLLDRIFTQSLERLRYIGPLRQRPQRLLIEDTQDQGTLGPGGEQTIGVLASDADLLSRVNAALQILEIPYVASTDKIRVGSEEHNLGEVSTLYLRDRRTDLLVTLADVGVGVSQTLPVVLQLYMQRGATVLVEQPELHLHPRLQARLADVVIDSIQTNHSQVILETHSEHLLYRLQRRIREGAIKARDVRVLYVANDEGQSRITEMELSESGDLLTPWPSGFFDDKLADLLS